jgi:photosystem II stability/assembly factor-like uncharacterized protein
MKLLLATFAAMTLGLLAGGPWSMTPSGTKVSLRGVSVVSAEVAWASGSEGTCLRTLDGGQTWKRLTVPDSSKLDFRDVQAFDANLAYLLSIGTGELSRIYKTTDGGTSWTLSMTNPDPTGFLDAIAFWDQNHGLAMGDPVNGRFVIFKTVDGGKNWEKIPAIGMPEAITGEGGFAASGTCLVVEGRDNAWFGTGGGSKSRIFRSTDGGRTWSVSDTPIRAGIPSAGVFSIAFRDSEHGLAVGGDYQSATDPSANFALSNDGGKTWDPLPKGAPSGFRSAVAFAPIRSGFVLSVGPSGADYSRNGGVSWKKFEGPGFHAISFDPSGKACWAVGPVGRIGKLDPESFDFDKP